MIIFSYGALLAILELYRLMSKLLMVSDLFKNSNFLGNTVHLSHENLLLEYEWDSGGGSEGRFGAIY